MLVLYYFYMLSIVDGRMNNQVLWCPKCWPVAAHLKVIPSEEMLKSILVQVQYMKYESLLLLPDTLSLSPSPVYWPSEFTTLISTQGQYDMIMGGYWAYRSHKMLFYTCGFWYVLVKFFNWFPASLVVISSPSPPAYSVNRSLIPHSEVHRDTTLHCS